MKSIPHLPSLQIWLRIQTGVFTHCAVGETNMPLTLGKAVIETNTVRILSSRPITVKVPQEM